MNGQAPLPASGAPARARPATTAIPLFLGLMVVYLLGGGPFPVEDALINMYLPVHVLSRGELTTTPPQSPFMFYWQFEEPYSTKWRMSHGGDNPPVQILSWDQELFGHRAGELYEEGLLTLSKPRYFVTESAHPGRYANIYGIGSGLCAVPYFSVLSLVKKDWRDNSRILWKESRLFSAACVAGSAVFIFLALLVHVPRHSALALSLAYGLGTCVYCEPSQAIWQQTPVLLFICGGLYFLTRLAAGPRWAAGCGLFLGIAAFCRPTVGILLVAVGIQVMLRRRSALIPFVAAAAVPLLALATANTLLLGSPFRFGQIAVAESFSANTSGAEPPSALIGAAGLLVSPSRGLLVFSPFLAFAFWGLWAGWRAPEFSWLRAPIVALAVGYLMASSWVFWHGGWCFGYRRLIEWVPILILCLAPVAERIRASRPLLVLFLLTALWSVGIEVAGSYAYDTVSWNGRLETDEESGRKIRLDVDDPRYQGRLWSLRDSQITWLFRPGALKDRAELWEKTMGVSALESERPTLGGR